MACGKASFSDQQDVIGITELLILLSVIIVVMFLGSYLMEIQYLWRNEIIFALKYFRKKGG